MSRGAEHLDDLDLNPLLVQADPTAAPPPYPRPREPVPPSLDEEMLKDAAALFERGEVRQLTYTVRNTQRAIGARISSAIVRRFGPTGLQEGRLTVQLHGSAGQSLGAFGAHGLRIELTGEANDYVAKGLSGSHPGDPALAPSVDARRARPDRLHRAVWRDLGAASSPPAGPASASRFGTPAPPR